MFVVLDHICVHLVAGSISVNANAFIVVMLSEEANICHERFYALEGKVHFVSPAKCFLSRLNGERCKDVCVLGPHLVVVIDSTKETTHLQHVFRFLHL